MACLPIALHASVSCMLGLGYGCGYITSLATYEIFNRKKKQKNSEKGSGKSSGKSSGKGSENSKNSEKNSDDIKQIEFVEKKTDEKTVNSSIGSNGNNYTINDLLNTLDEVKTELQYTREKLELFDHKLEDNIASNKTVEKEKSKRYRTMSF